MAEMSREMLTGALALVWAAACSSAALDESHAPEPSPPGAGVFDACVDFAIRLCADAEGCCRQAHGGFDPSACVESFEREVCRPGADAVAAGLATFDDDLVEDCLAAHAEAHRVCVPTWAETLELRKRIYAACRVIDGVAEPGSPCALSANCKRPPGHATAECVRNTCRALEVLPEGAACPFPDGSVSVCDAGLTCDAAGPGEQGTCVDAIPTGEACNGLVLESTACGLGSYCDPLSSTCRLASNAGGSGCAQSTECLSFDCDRLADVCAPAPAVVGRDTCLGAEAMR